ncbi:MAG: nuclear transport factor 2 family protein [Vicinamibacteria bacterium]
MTRRNETAVVEAEADVARGEIQALIEASYVNGAFNDLDTRTMREGFHPVFRIHGVLPDGGLRQLPIEEWIAAIEKRKGSPDFDPTDQKWEHRFALIDVTGAAAVAKIELFKDSRHVYTDYLSLLKLGGGWKITDKVVHLHPES